LDADAAAAILAASFTATVAQSALARVLPMLARAVGNRTTLPILGNVLIEARKGPSGDALADGTLLLTTNNLEVVIATSVTASVEREGIYTVPHHVLLDTISKLPAGPVKLACNGTHLTITAGRSKTTVRGIDAEDFPPEPVPTGASYTLPAGNIRQIIEHIVPAAALDETRPVLGGVHLVFAPGTTIRTESSDSFRAAFWPDVPGTEQPDTAEAHGVIVPRKSLEILGRLLPRKLDDATVIPLGLNENVSCLQFTVPAPADGEIGARRVTIRLIEGQFPDISRVVPKSPTTLVTIPRALFASAVARAATFARDAGNIMRAEFKDGTMTLAAATAEVGSSTDQVECEIEGEDTSISLSTVYLTQLLTALKGDSVRLKLMGPLSPAVFEDDDVPGYQCVIMPIERVN